MTWPWQETRLSCQKKKRFWQCWKQRREKTKWERTIDDKAQSQQLNVASEGDASKGTDIIYKTRITIVRNKRGWENQQLSRTKQRTHKNIMWIWVNRQCTVAALACGFQINKLWLFISLHNELLGKINRAQTFLCFFEIYGREGTNGVNWSYVTL